MKRWMLGLASAVTLTTLSSLPAATQAVAYRAPAARPPSVLADAYHLSLKSAWPQLGTPDGACRNGGDEMVRGMVTRKADGTYEGTLDRTTLLYFCGAHAGGATPASWCSRETAGSRCVDWSCPIRSARAAALSGSRGGQTPTTRPRCGARARRTSSIRSGRCTSACGTERNSLFQLPGRGCGSGWRTTPGSWRSSERHAGRQGSPLPAYVPRGLVVAQPEKPRVAEQPRPGPLAEADLGDQLRRDPLHRSARHRSGRER